MVIADFLNEYRDEFKENAYKEHQKKKWAAKKKPGCELVYNCGVYEFPIVYRQAEMKDDGWPIITNYLHINHPVMVYGEPVPYTIKFRYNGDGISYKDEHLCAIPQFGFKDPVELVSFLKMDPRTFIQPFVFNNELSGPGKVLQLQYLQSYCENHSIPLARGMDINTIHRLFCGNDLGDWFRSEWGMWKTPKGGLFIGPIGNTIITFHRN